MNYTNTMAETNLLEGHFRELTAATSPEYEFPSDVEALYECERIMALPGYKQLPIYEQAEVERRREQILQNWQAGIPVQSDDCNEPHDDRLLRYKFNMLKSLWAQYQGEPLPEYGRVRFS
jgi:hypothetical protein